MGIVRTNFNLSVRPSVCPFVTRVDQSKTVQAKITKSLLSAVRKTLVSGTRTRTLNERGVRKFCNFRPISRCITETVRDRA